MVTSDESEDHLYKKHKDLCRTMNLDQQIISQAWESFTTIKNSYALEGEPLHWLGCAVFVACRETVTPTVGQAFVEGNCVNLTSLLRHCSLSLAQFFNKIKRWSDMANMNEEFRRKIESLEGNFAVSCNVFKEYAKTFGQIFKNPTDIEQNKHHRSRKQKSFPCTPEKVFEFVWNLFITLKGQHLSCSDDLVTSVHLMQACCDLAFKNAFFASNRKELLNPDFKGLPLDWNSPDFVPPEEAPCIIDKISDMDTEAKYMKTYHCRTFIMNMFNSGTLRGNDKDFTGLFDADTFEINFKNINKAYEAHLLNKLDFDERIFLAEYRRRTLIREQAINNSALAISASVDAGDVAVSDSPRNNQHQYGEVVQAIQQTPLTGRRYLSAKEDREVTPLSTATQSIAKLQSLLSGRQPAPSEALLQLFQSCAKDPTETIKDVEKRLGEKFVLAYTDNAPAEQTVQIDYARKRLEFAVTLFYKLIENLLQNETTIRKDISTLVENVTFYECVLACSIEIVIYSYNCQRKFPWILEALEIQPYNFVKIIELIVRTKDQFSRDAVKHLNLIEETILESLAWKSESQLWADIRKSNQELPKFEDTALPGNIKYGDASKQIPTINRIIPASPMQSPCSSAVDRFQSPNNNTPVKKQLFKTTPSHYLITEKDGTKRYVPIDIELRQSSSSAVEVAAATTPQKPKRTGGLAIFFRKFYMLAGVRLDDLCEKLNITDTTVVQKIWTVFVHSIRCQTELMRDRHLDQLLMCAVYALCKVTCPNRINFMEIMTCYRQQPQANSNVYRNVLMRPVRGFDSTPFAETGDLINFYNHIYVQVMKDVIAGFAATSRPNSNIMLSPLPAPKANLVSPKLQVRKNVFIKPYDADENPNLSGKKVLNYYFSRSPSKDLRDINNAVNDRNITRKRLLIYDYDAPPNKKLADRKMQSLIEDRKSHNAE